MWSLTVILLLVSGQDCQALGGNIRGRGSNRAGGGSSSGGDRSTIAFENYLYWQTLPEQFPVGDIFKLHPHATSSGGGKIQYSIISGDSNNLFKIDQDTGEIRTTRKLDRETKSNYLIILQAKDLMTSSSATTTVSVIVSDANDNGPQCDSPRTESVRQVAPPGQVVLDLHCRDRDEGRNAESEYQLSPTGYLPFNVSQHGNILVASPLLYRTDKQGNTRNLNTYTFHVTVRNIAPPHKQTTVSVTINIHQSDCPTDWEYDISRDRKLSVKPLQSPQLSLMSCRQRCSGETGCNSFNWESSVCELLADSALSEPQHVETRPGSMLFRKYCITDPEPSPKIKKFLNVMDQALSAGGLIAPDMFGHLLRELHDYSGSLDDQTRTDTWVVASSLRTLVERTDITAWEDNSNRSCVQLMTGTVSHLLQDVYVDHWRKLHLVGNESSTLLMSMETMMTSLSKNLSTELRVRTDQVEVLGVQVETGVPTDVRLSPGPRPPSTVSLPAGLVHSDGGLMRVVVSVFEDLDRVTNVTEPWLPSNNSQITSETSDRERVLQGDIVSVVVDPPPPSTFTHPVVLEILSIPEDSMKVLSRQCVFLNHSDSRAEWVPDGCVTSSFNTSHTRCECFHLSNFAVLMQIVHIEVDEAVELSLEVVTYLGCVVSILSLTATIITNILLKMRSERVMLLISLSTALILAQVVFMAGAGATQDKTTCRVMAALLHYLYLTVFSLMLVEGLQLYLRLYLAFNRDGKALVCIIAGWGLPVLLVGISVGADPDGYGTSYSCWLSTERGTIWAFVGPALIISVVNLFVLGVVIRTFLGLRVNARKTDRQKFVSSLKAACVLLPLLGITWLFGVLAINSSTLAFQYIFALLNSSQGLFIFLFHVVCNDEVRVAYWKRRGRILTVNSATHSQSTAVSSTIQARKKAFAGFITTNHM